MASHDDDEEDRPALILRIGTEFSCAGYSGDDSPRSRFPTAVGVPSSSSSAAIMSTSAAATSLLRNACVGDEAFERRQYRCIRNPFQTHGLITSSQWYDIMIHHMFYSELRVDPSDYDVVIMVIDTHLPPSHKEEIASLMFSKFSVKRLAFMETPLASVLNAGRTSGLVIHIGSQLTSVTPVFDWTVMRHAAVSEPYGGKDITKAVLNATDTWSSTYLGSSVDEILDDMKRSVCYVSVDPSQEQNIARSMNYTFPDGSQKDIVHGRWRPCEGLFDPTHFRLSSDVRSVQQLVVDCLLKCPPELRQHLANNMVLTGRTNRLSGLKERLKLEIAKISGMESLAKAVPELIDPRTNNPTGTLCEEHQDPAALPATFFVAGSAEYYFESWTGASIFYSLRSVRYTVQMCSMTEEDFKEKGARFAHCVHF